MSEYPNYPPQMQAYPAAYPAPYPAVPPVATYQPQYPAAAPLPQSQPLQQIIPAASQGAAPIQPPHPKKTHLPSDQRMKVHTIFMFNLVFGLTHEELLRFCKQFGDVSQLIYPLVKPGQAFCTYYDLRAAERAVKEMVGKKLNGRPVKTNFAYKPPPHSRRDPKELCSTILVKSSKGEESTISFDDIKEAMSAFGELRDAEEVYEDTNKGNDKSTESNEQKEEGNKSPKDSTSRKPIQGQWIVKYYDLRDSQKCVETGMVQYKDEELHLEFILDDDMGDEVTDPNPPPKRNRTYSHDQRHDQYDYYEPPSQIVAPPPPVQPAPAQMQYGYPPQPYPYMGYPYGQVPYGYPPQPYPYGGYAQQVPTQPIAQEIPAQIPPQMPGQIPPQIPGQLPGQIPTQIPGQIPPQIPGQISAQVPGQNPTQTAGQTIPPTTQYPRSDQYLQPTQSQIPYQAPQQTIQTTSLPPLPPLPPPPPSQSQPQPAPPSQPKPPSPIQPSVPTSQPAIPQPHPTQQTRSLLSVMSLNDDNQQEDKIPEAAPNQQKSMPSALSLMGLDSDDTPNDFSNDFDSFDSDNSKKNNNSNNGHKGSLSFLE